MTTQVQLRRGTKEQNDAFVGAVGELTYCTDSKELRIHDGVTIGGGAIMTIKDIINIFTQYMAPDYSNMASIGSPFSCPKSGWIIGNLDGGGVNSRLYVNGIALPTWGNDAYNEGPICAPVNKDDVVTYTSLSNATFIPIKATYTI